MNDTEKDRRIAELEAQIEAAGAQALYSVLDRLGADGVVASLNKMSAVAAEDEIYRHVQWLEERAKDSERQRADRLQQELAHEEARTAEYHQLATEQGRRADRAEAALAKSTLQAMDAEINMKAALSRVEGERDQARADSAALAKTAASLERDREYNAKLHTEAEARSLLLEKALRDIRALVAGQPSAVATAIIATCDALSSPGSASATSCSCTDHSNWRCVCCGAAHGEACKHSPERAAPAADPETCDLEDCAQPLVPGSDMCAAHLKWLDGRVGELQQALATAPAQPEPAAPTPRQGARDLAGDLLELARATEGRVLALEQENHPDEYTPAYLRGESAAYRRAALMAHKLAAPTAGAEEPPREGES